MLWKILVLFLCKQLRSCILAYSYERLYVETRTSPCPLPCPATATIPARPAIPARSDAAVLYLQPNFFRAQNHLFFRIYQIFSSREGKREKFGTNLLQKEKTNLLQWSDLARRAAPHRALCPGFLLSCSHLKT